MLLIIMLILFVLCVILWSYFYDRRKYESFIPTVIVLTVVFGVYALIGTITSVWYYSEKIEKEASLTTFNQKEIILKDKANSTMSLLKIEVERYYQHELTLFKELVPENISILLVKYPELRTSGVVMTYFEEIIKLNNAIYDLRFKRTDYEACIVYYTTNKLLFVP